MLAMAAMPALAAELTPVAACFSKAAASYVGAARLQREVAFAALAELKRWQLNLKQPSLGHLLDLGCGPGWIQPELSKHASKITAIDLSAGMLAQAASQGLDVDYLLADAAALPLSDNSLDTVFSSLMLQWCDSPARVFSEVARVLKPGGYAVFTTLIEGTLTELAQAFSAVDDYAHIHPFFSLTQLEAALHLNTSTVLQWHLCNKCYQLPYTDIFALARELKALGANHIRRRANQGLTGKGYWQQVAAAYPGAAQQAELLASYQVVQLVAYKPVA